MGCRYSSPSKTFGQLTAGMRIVTGNALVQNIDEDLVENLKVPQLLTKFSALYGTQRVIIFLMLCVSCIFAYTSI